MANINIRIGKGNSRELENRCYFQIERDGKLLLHSIYGEPIVDELMKQNLIAIGFVRNLQTLGIQVRDYSLIDGEIIDDINGLPEVVSPMGEEFSEELKRQIELHYQLVAMSN
ncbi:hypothetical protein GOV12_03580 [Candidatus Pacearchaeota archaeon]|nr:hypothetical protein [Candidatus Pacearchaeota archaeon]